MTIGATIPGTGTSTVATTFGGIVQLRTKLPSIGVAGSAHAQARTISPRTESSFPAIAGRLSIKGGAMVTRSKP
jgi:hypothetical protein